MNETLTYIIKKIEKKQDVVILNLTPKEGSVFDFKPGQYVMLAIYGKKGNIWQQRSFSLCSSPLNKKFIQLAVKIYGEFTQKVATLKEGDSVGISGPYGFFVFNEKKMKETILLAGGIGITPFMSIIRYISEAKLTNKILLFYSNRKKEDITFFEELKFISQRHKNIQVIFSLTKNNSQFWEYEKGRIDEEMIKKYCPLFQGKYFSLCGPLQFMESILSQLEKDGVSKDYIEMERFK